MSFKASMDELKKVTYLRLDDLQGRAVPFFPCYHGDKDWELWLPNNEGLQRTKPIDMKEGKYYSKEPAHEGDVYLAFFDFMCKRAYWQDIVPFIEGIHDDLQNLGACLAKLDFFHKEWKKTHFDAKRFVVTELEYILLVCRSLYDLVQECNFTMWPKFKFKDPKYGKTKLRKSFADIVLENNQPRNKEEIMSRWAIPELLAEYYARQTTFFYWLREYRVYISHSGKGIDFVFETEKGFAVSTDVRPFSTINIWEECNTQPHKLGSVRSLVAHLIISTFKAVEEFALVMSTIVTFPADMAPDYHIFLCGAHVASLQNLESHIKERPWYEY